MNEEQARSLDKILDGEVYKSLSDVETLDKLNGPDKARAARAITSAKLLEWAAGRDVDVKLRLALEAEGTSAQQKAKLRTVLLLIERDAATLDLGNQANVDQVDALVTAGVMTEADRASLDLLAWPSAARRAIGRDATAEDLAAAEGVGAARAALEDAMGEARDTYQAAVATALGGLGGEG